MMGGSGGSSFSPPTDNVRKQVEEMLKKERERLQADLSSYLAELLAHFNARDEDLDRERLNQLLECLGDGVDVETLLLGGSVAKHTAVDGISDVDGLVILDKPEVQGKTPAEVLERLRSILDASRGRDDIESVTKGEMAVTVKYSDGREIQLLPAVRTGDEVKISNAAGTSWKEISPSEFQKKLSTANDETNGAIVPAIKLLKAVNDTLPTQKRMTGYHIEALAVDAVKEYSGAKTLKAIFERIVEHAESRVMRPIQDVTGQSRTVDDYLGPADDWRRRNISQTLGSLQRRLAAATSVSDWRAGIRPEFRGK